MSLRNDFNPHLADAYCTALLLGQTTEAQILLGFPSFPHHLLVEKFADAILANNIDLMNKLYETKLININDYCRNGQETFLTLALKNRLAYKGNPHLVIGKGEPNTKTVTCETIKTLLSYPDLDAGKCNKRQQAPITLAITLSDSRPFLAMIPRPDIDVNVANIWGKALLMELVGLTGSAAAQMLTATLARPELDKNAVTENGASALLFAAYNEDPNIMNIFLSSGGIIFDTIANNDINPLKAASNSGNVYNYNAIQAAMNPNP